MIGSKSSWWLSDCESSGADSDLEVEVSPSEGLLIIMCFLVVGFEIEGLLAGEGKLDLSATLLGFNVGTDLDFTLGLLVATGFEVGFLVGRQVGFTKGFIEGFRVRENVGLLLGFIVDGVALGFREGFRAGESL